MAENTKQPMPLTKKNYLYMLVGVLIIVLGFLLMSGGGDHTVTEFDWSIYSTRRITIAPIMVLMGFVIVALGIMLRFPKRNDKDVE